MAPVSIDHGSGPIHGLLAGVVANWFSCSPIAIPGPEPGRNRPESPNSGRSQPGNAEKIQSGRKSRTVPIRGKRPIIQLLTMVFGAVRAWTMVPPSLTMARPTRSGSRRKAPVRRRPCGRPAPGGSCSRDTRVGADRLSASGEGRPLQIARVHPGPLRSFPSVTHSRRVQMSRMSWRSRLESLRLRRSRMRSWIAAKSSGGRPRSVADGRDGRGSRRPGGCCCLHRPLRPRTPSPIQTECCTTHSPHGCVDNIDGRNTT